MRDHAFSMINQRNERWGRSQKWSHCEDQTRANGMMRLVAVDLINSFEVVHIAAVPYEHNGSSMVFSILVCPKKNLSRFYRFSQYLESNYSTRVRRERSNHKVRDCVNSHKFKHAYSIDRLHQITVLLFNPGSCGNPLDDPNNPQRMIRQLVVRSNLQ